jgi:polysaccharide biosynthesis transport protein
MDTAMNDSPERPRDPLPARRSSAAPLAPASEVYEDYAAEPGGGPAKRTMLRLVTRALSRHWWQAMLLWLVGSAGLIAVAYNKIKPTYDAFAQIYVELGDNPIFIQNGAGNIDASQYIQTQVALITSPPVLMAALSEHPELTGLPLLAGQADPESELRGALVVGQEPKTSLIRVAMSSPVPVESAAFVNAVVHAYLKAAMQTYDASTQRKIDRLKAVRDGQEKEVERLRREVKVQQEKIGASDIDAVKNRNNISAEGYRRVSEELTGVEIKLIQTKARLDQYRDEPSRGRGEEEIKEIETQLFYDHPQVARLNAELQKAKERKEEATRLTRSPSDPAVVNYTRKIETLTKKIDQLWQQLEPSLRKKAVAPPGDEAGKETVKLIEAEYAAMNSHAEALRTKLDRLRIENKAAEGEGLKLQFAIRDLERADQVLDRIQQNLQQLEYQAKDPVARVELKSEARPSLKANSKKRIATIVAAPLFVGLLVAGLLVLLELRGARVNDPDELASRIQVQVIGMVPPLPQIRAGSPGTNGHGGDGQGDNLPLAAGDLRAQRQLDEFVQSLDHLRVALCARPDPWGRDRHCVLITSAIGSEGKTTLAAQLAERCVNAGLMTLLIDGDLRNPTLSRMLDAAENPGLINVLRGETSPEDVVTVVGDAGGFHLLPAGTPRMDPSRLLQGDRFGRLLAQARESFDMIIVDAPPVLPVPDALTIGRWTDGAVLAVRYDNSRLPLVERARRKLAHVGVPIIGAVVNGVRSAESYGGYYTYGGYGGYGSTATPSSAS